MNSQKKCFNCQ